MKSEVILLGIVATLLAVLLLLRTPTKEVKYKVTCPTYEMVVSVETDKDADKRVHHFVYPCTASKVVL